MKEADALIKHLKALPHDAQMSELKKYPVETLESLAVNYYDNSFGEKSKFKLLDNILHERADKLNANFEWTEEHKQRFKVKL